MKVSFGIGAAAAAMMVSAPAQADVATDWWQLADRYYGEGQRSGAPRTIDTERASSRTALAVFEAVNAIDRRYESYLGLPQASASASQDAAAATAAHDVLVAHYPARKDDLHQSYVLAMAAIPEGPARDVGVEIGRRSAAAAVGANGAMPGVAPIAYRPQTRPGGWIGASLPSLGPYWATMKPWVQPSPDALRPPPPPALGSETYARDLDEVKRLGARASKERSEWQTLIAQYRQGYDASPSIRWLTDRPGRRQVDNARLLAIYQMAFDDAVQAMAVAKIHYEFWRPITAIRNADRDDNAATTLDPNWVPLLGTPNFQEYPCGHCTVVAATAEVMEKAGQWPAGQPLRVAAGGGQGVVDMQVASWRELVRQVSDSRMYGGVHYRFSNDAGEAIGRAAASAVINRAMQPLKAASKKK